MNSTELEQYLTIFLKTMREADFNYKKAVDEETYPNEAIQDLLHAAELAPSSLNYVNLSFVLNQLRGQRRTAKRELEVTELIKEWADENKTALNKLENVLGQVRKILKRQSAEYYIYKTNILGEKGTSLIPE